MRLDDRILFFAIGYFIVGLLSGCATSTVTLFQNSTGDKNAKFAPTDPSSVGVYRSTHPFASFTEIGLINFTTADEDLNFIYQKLRSDGAKQGAEAIVDVKIGNETHTESETIQVCNSTAACSIEGMCTPTEVCHPETREKLVTTYTTEGSMIRRKP